MSLAGNGSPIGTSGLFLVGLLLNSNCINGRAIKSKPQKQITKKTTSLRSRVAYRSESVCAQKSDFAPLIAIRPRWAGVSLGFDNNVARTGSRLDCARLISNNEPFFAGSIRFVS